MALFTWLFSTELNCSVRLAIVSHAHCLSSGQSLESYQLNQITTIISWEITTIFNSVQNYVCKCWMQHWEMYICLLKCASHCFTACLAAVHWILHSPSLRLSIMLLGLWSKFYLQQVLKHNGCSRFCWKYVTGGTPILSHEIANLCHSTKHQISVLSRCFWIPCFHNAAQNFALVPALFHEQVKTNLVNRNVNVAH